MKKIFLIVMACFCIFFMFMVMQTCNDHIHENRAIIGKKIVIGRDTLIIIGYSYWDSKYSLNNGTQLVERYVLNNYLKDQE